MLVPWAIWQKGWQALKPLVGIALLSLVTLFAIWPWLWGNPVVHFLEFARYHLGHEILPSYYFGTIYTDPPAPWHYSPVMIAITTPPIILFLGLAGVVHSIRNCLERRDCVLLLSGLLLPILPFVLLRVLVYNGLRLFIASPIFLAGLAGVGFSLVLAFVTRVIPAGISASSRKKSAVGLILGLLLLAPGIYGMIDLHPYSFVYLNFLAGGEKGGLPPPEGHGFETVLWSEAAGPEVVKWINENLEEGATIHINSGAFGSLREQKRIGRLRGDISFAGDADYWVLNSQFAYWSDSRFWDLWRNGDAEYRMVKRFGPPGVPVLNIYKRNAQKAISHGLRP